MLYDGFGNAWNSSVAREMPRIVSSYQFTCACKASKGSGVCTYTLTKGRQRRRGRAVRGSNHDNHRCTAGQEKNQMERPVLHHLANESDGAITDRSVEQPCPSYLTVKVLGIQIRATKLNEGFHSIQQRRAEDGNVQCLSSCTLSLELT